MNEIIVPVDLTEEEKAVLAVFSLRQFYIIGPTLVLSSIFLIFGGIPFISGFVDFLLRLLVWIVAVGIAVAVAFIKIERYDQYLNEFIINKLLFWRSQKVYYP